MAETIATENRSDRTPAISVEPYIRPSTHIREFTARGVIIGTILGAIFGASSLYLVLKVGLTVSASIPVAVISVALFRLWSKFGGKDATILENNIVQTAGSAGESLAFGVGVTMPAILILGFDLEITRVMLVALLGVGYIIGPRIGSIMCAGGVLSYLVLIPLIGFFGSSLPSPLPPGSTPIGQMSPGQIRGAYILYIGAGAVAAGGIISLIRSL